ncbi:PREDICTED: putative methyltransferase DDB_G0268948, partial [Chlamydotis macqueenii]|uniref:putative methyltransferase DDB_G0268948 n=1 Tax=Chlamydotis macqueenii TaxID=187382 RepID=UPI00052A05C9
NATSPELVVDVGCGSGQGTRFLAEHFKKVVGTDISEAQIQEARDATSPPNVSYLVCPAEELPFGDASVDLLASFSWDVLLKYSHSRVKHVLEDYKEIFEALPFPDKKRITNIFDQIPMTVAGVVGYLESVSPYQTFKKNDPEAAKTLLQETEKRMLETMGVSSAETPVEFWVRHVCVLGCKGK